ncbi:MAG: GIY-YIG nuclease family protein, partial [Gammaproteobacteria bacterium]|nr:GIY-YIG nuclease family protein [Gammaproteobacteria bacterium]
MDTDTTGSTTTDSTTEWYVYIIRCSDASLYTGITTDVERRFAEHANHNG